MFRTSSGRLYFTLQIGQIAPGSSCSTLSTLDCTIGANATKVLSLLLLLAWCIYSGKRQSSPSQWALRISGSHHCSGMYPSINPYLVLIESGEKRPRTAAMACFRLTVSHSLRLSVVSFKILRCSVLFSEFLGLSSADCETTVFIWAR